MTNAVKSVLTSWPLWLTYGFIYLLLNHYWVIPVAVLCLSEQMWVKSHECVSFVRHGFPWRTACFKPVPVKECYRCVRCVWVSCKRLQECVFVCACVRARARARACVEVSTQTLCLIISSVLMNCWSFH